MRPIVATNPKGCSSTKRRCRPGSTCVNTVKRVTWPTWKQVRATTLVVIVAVFAFAAYFFVVDFLVGRSITKIFDALTR